MNKKILQIFASIALIITQVNVNTMCWWIAYQDEVPESAFEKYSKFRK